MLIKLRDRIVSAWRLPLVQCLLISFLLNFVIEIICRRSFVSAVVFTFTRPHFFLVGFLFVFLTISLSLFMRKRLFGYLLVSVLWLALAITNCVLILVRTAPLEAVDFSILRTGLGIITVYMEVWQIVLVAVAILTVLGAVIWFGIRAKKSKREIKSGAIALGGAAALLMALLLPLNLCGVYPRVFSNLTDSYRDYGFPYCFICSAFDRGVDKPEGYDKETLLALRDHVNAENPESIENRPNIIFLQLESFMDVSRLKNITFSEDPTPFFSELKERYTSGLLQVPTIGAGTANTEFEVITGMSQYDFGTGEYPYKSFLQKRACESLPHILRSYGYTSHAIHNHTGTFYERNDAYASLGFDTFVPVEYMQNVERTDLGWAKDAVLTGEILSCLASSEGSDVILTISVQGHGKYSVMENPRITATSSSMTKEELDPVIYYVNQLAEMDAFLRELTAALSAFGEDVLLVMYGDHLPSLGFGVADLGTGSMYETDYVIWSNMDLPKRDAGLTSYQLAAYALLQADIACGNLIRLHQLMLRDGEADYDLARRFYEYDMLDGEHYLYGGKNPYQRTELQMGVKPIVISEVRTDGEDLLIFGEHFTEWSIVYRNGKRCDTVFVDNNTLRVEDEDAKRGDRFTVCQVTKDRFVLGESERYLIE